MKEESCYFVIYMVIQGKKMLSFMDVHLKTMNMKAELKMLNLE
jgi:hypothetical protein